MWAVRRAGQPSSERYTPGVSEPAAQWDIVLRKVCLYLVPHLRNLLKNGSGLDAPAVKATPPLTRQGPPSASVWPRLVVFVMMIACRGSAF